MQAILLFSFLINLLSFYSWAYLGLFLCTFVIFSKKKQVTFSPVDLTVKSTSLFEKEQSNDDVSRVQTGVAGLKAQMYPLD